MDHCRPFENENKSYFSLTNTFQVNPNAVSQSDKFNNFFHRFSQQLTLDDRHKLLVEKNKKRFSLETGEINYKINKNLDESDQELE